MSIRIAIILSLLLTPCAIRAADTVSGVRAVYLLPMAQGLDQYLANRLANAGVFSIVTNITKADAVLSGVLGRPFEAQLTELIEEAQPPVEADSEDPPSTDTVHKEMPVSTFGRGRGTVFLIDLSSRKVLWSTWAPAKNATPKALDRAAGEIVERLEKVLDRQSGPGER